MNSEWVSVDERLPEKNIRVWAFYTGTCVHSGTTWNRDGCWFAAWWDGSWNSTLVAEALSKLDADDVRITHWMPLPEPPETRNKT